MGVVHGTTRAGPPRRTAALCSAATGAPPPRACVVTPRGPRGPARPRFPPASHQRHGGRTPSASASRRAAGARWREAATRRLLAPSGHRLGSAPLTGGRQMWTRLITRLVLGVLASAALHAWPSECRAQLAATPWPMFQHDPHHTGRTSVVGPSTANIKWIFQAPDAVWNSASVGTGGDIYVSVGYMICALKPAD